MFDPAFGIKFRPRSARILVAGAPIISRGEMQESQLRRLSSRPTFNYDASTYVPAVDGLRGIAILLVLWYHAPFLFRDLPEFTTDYSPWEALGLAGTMSLGGWIGVDLFVVSGN